MREILDQLDGRALTDDVAVDDRHLCTPARQAPHRRRVVAAVAVRTFVAAVARGSTNREARNPRGRPRPP